MSTKRTILVVGDIGTPENPNKEQFDKVKKDLEAIGEEKKEDWIVTTLFSDAFVLKPEDASHSVYEKAVPILEIFDTVFLVRGWEQNKGAESLKLFAEARGIEIWTKDKSISEEAFSEPINSGIIIATQAEIAQSLLKARYGLSIELDPAFWAMVLAATKTAEGAIKEDPKFKVEAVVHMESANHYIKTR